VLIVIKTKILKVSRKSIKEAVESIKNGGLVVYPTETSYGIGCDATNPTAVKKLYKIKGRGKTKPISIIVSDLKMISKYGEITDRVRHLVEKFMPGPLTIVIKKKKTTLGFLSRGGIAFRISSHPVANVLVKDVGLPITATSANLSGAPPIYDVDEVVRTFKSRVDMILDCGSLKGIAPSTIIDMRNGKLKIIREGPIKSEKILKEVRQFRKKLPFQP